MNKTIYLKSSSVWSQAALLAAARKTSMSDLIESLLVRELQVNAARIKARSGASLSLQLERTAATLDLLREQLDAIRTQVYSDVR